MVLLIRVTEPDKNIPVVLVIDALDESERIGLPPRVNSLYLPPSLPEGAFIIVASRPLENLRLIVSNSQTLFLEPDSKYNLLDIRAYIENYIHNNTKLINHLTNWQVTQEDFIEALVVKCEGNFIYLYYVLPAIVDGKFQRGTVDELPQGLQAYYEGHWNQMQIEDADEFENLYAPVVCMLAVVREPVTIDQLGKWSAIDETKIKRAIRHWREFLEVEVTPPPISSLPYKFSRLFKKES